MASQFLARPFAALRPTAESAADVIAPPYDVVSTDEARTLAANRPASFLYISRPEIDLPPGSSLYSDAAYKRGAENLARLRDGGALFPRSSEHQSRLFVGVHLGLGGQLPS